MKDTLEKRSSAIEGLTEIEKLGKIQSKTSAPTQLRSKLKKIYNQHGKTYNANTHMGTIYANLKNWTEEAELTANRLEDSKRTVAARIISKRGSPTKPARDSTKINL
jgi:hypothetical protein